RRHEEYRRPFRRIDHGGAIVAALRRQDAVGTSRHRRYGAGVAADRYQQELECGVGRSSARTVGEGLLRGVSQGEPGVRRMTEGLFYHLDGQRVEAVLPPLLEKSLARGWRAAVQTASDDRIDSLDAHLWTYREDSFLPHGTDRDNAAASQPILLTSSDGN